MHDAAQRKPRLAGNERFRHQPGSHHHRALPEDATFIMYSGPCNSFNCLGHFKTVYDDDDDDDAVT